MFTFVDEGDGILQNVGNYLFNDAASRLIVRRSALLLGEPHSHRLSMNWACT